MAGNGALAATANYNAPDRPEDSEASFLALGDAQAYAEAYGGEIEHRGVVFVVRGADNETAKTDLAKLRSEQAAASAGVAPVASGPSAAEFDAAVQAAVERQLAKLLASQQAPAPATAPAESDASAPTS